jgi:hypothetical protein
MRISTAIVLGSLWAAQALAGDDLGPTTPTTPELARAAFGRFRALEGTWDGRSTKGWVETLRYQSIAAGSTVLETSLDAHPGEEMAADGAAGRGVPALGAGAAGPRPRDSG